MPERRGTLCFDSACLDLARHFYPEFPEHVLATLAQQLQDTCEDFTLTPPGNLEGCVDDVIAERISARPLNDDEIGK